MDREQALDAVWRAHMVTRAVSLMRDEDLDEDCFAVLCRESLRSASDELAQAHEALSDDAPPASSPAPRERGRASASTRPTTAGCGGTT